MFERSVLAAIVVVTSTSTLLAEPGDELLGDWERTVGAKRIREVWHVARSGKQLRLTGRYFQGDKEVGKFRGEGETFDEASGTLRCKLVVDLAGQSARQNEADYELALKGTRLAVTTTLGKRKETLNLTKAKASTLPETSTAATGNAPGTAAERNLQPGPDLPSFVEVRRIEVGPIGFLFEVAISPDGKLLALADVPQDGKVVAIYDIDAGAVVKHLPAEGTLCHMAFTEGGSTFVAAALSLSKTSYTIAWDTATWAEKWRLDNGGTIKHAISGDGKWYAAAKGNVPGGPNGVLKVWDLTKQAEVYAEACPQSPRLAWSAEGRMLLHGSSTPAIFDRQTRKNIAAESGRGTPSGTEGEISAIAITPDGRGYALGDVHGGSAALVTSSGKLVKSFPRLNEGQGAVGDVAFIDGRKLLVAHRACEFALFDISTGRALAYTRDKNAGKRTTSDIDYHPGCPRFAAYCGSEVVVYQLPQ